MRSSTKDIFAALFCLAVAAAFLAQTGELDGISLYFPHMLLIFICFFSLVLLGSALFKIGKERAEAPECEPVSIPRVATISVTSIVYVAVIPLLGFYPTSVLFLFISALLLKDSSTDMKKTVVAATVFTLVLCLCVWGGFSLLLGVPTPESVLFQSP